MYTVIPITNFTGPVLTGASLFGADLRYYAIFTGAKPAGACKGAVRILLDQEADAEEWSAHPRWVNVQLTLPKAFEVATMNLRPAASYSLATSWRCPNVNSPATASNLRTCPAFGVVIAASALR